MAGDGVTVGVAVGSLVGEAVAVEVSAGSLVCVGVEVGVSVGSLVGEAVTVKVADGSLVDDGVDVEVSVGSLLGEAVAVEVTDGSLVGDGVDVGVSVGSLVGDEVGVEVADGSTVGVGVRVEVAASVMVAVAVEVGVAEGSRVDKRVEVAGGGGMTTGDAGNSGDAATAMSSGATREAAGTARGDATGVPEAMAIASAGRGEAIGVPNTSSGSTLAGEATGEREVAEIGVPTASRGPIAMGEAIGDVSTVGPATGDSSMMCKETGDVRGVEGAVRTGLDDSAAALARAGDATNDVLVAGMIASGVPGKSMLSGATGEPGAVGEVSAFGRAMVDWSGTPPGKRMTVSPLPPSPIRPTSAPIAKLKNRVASASATAGLLIENSHQCGERNELPLQSENASSVLIGSQQGLSIELPCIGARLLLCNRSFASLIGNEIAVSTHLNSKLIALPG